MFYPPNATRCHKNRTLLTQCCIAGWACCHARLQLTWSLVLCAATCAADREGALNVSPVCVCSGSGGHAWDGPDGPTADAGDAGVRLHLAHAAVAALHDDESAGRVSGAAPSHRALCHLSDHRVETCSDGRRAVLPVTFGVRECGVVQLVILFRWRGQLSWSVRLLLRGVGWWGVVADDDVSGAVHAAAAVPVAATRPVTAVETSLW